MRVSTKGRTPRILAVAYSCDPVRGSEAAVSWGIVKSLAKYADVTVLVGEEHLPAIELWQQSHPDVRTRFVPVPYPQGQRWMNWHRIPWFISYFQWLNKAEQIGRDLHETHGFDLVFHMSVAAYWTPIPLSHLGVPIIWGPVGGAVTTPRALWPLLGWRGLLEEWLDYVSVRTLARRWIWRHRQDNVASVLVNNQETLEQLPGYLRERATILNHVLFVDPPLSRPVKKDRSIVFFAALKQHKGSSVVVRALKFADKSVRLKIVGDGPQRASLERKVRRLGLQDRVEFFDKLSRAQAHDVLINSSAAVFAGFREEGGASLAEAMLSGVPVIVLANGGAKWIAENGLDASRVELIEPDNAERVVRRMAVAMNRFSATATLFDSPNLDQAKGRRMLRSIVERVLSQEGFVPASVPSANLPEYAELSSGPLVGVDGTKFPGAAG